ncbi:MAG: hypothetical protein KBD56_09255 [Candidatus Eisenbacteria bacterium]|nr:hypothetical protein [Candidatus Eisenbacteria bacterium]
MNAFPGKNPSTTQIAEICTGVLRESALLGARLLPRAPREKDWDALGEKMTFSGSMRGQMEAWVPRRIAARLAANLLGLDPTGFACGKHEKNQGEEESGRDALRELLALLCADLLAGLNGGCADVRLGTAHACDRPTRFEGPGAESDLWIDIEGEPILLRLWLLPT